VDNQWRPAIPAAHLPARELRASDADRERAVDLLGDALADGRLTAVEHAERMERAYTSRTLGELAALTIDLAPAEQQPVRVDDRPVHALFGSLRRSGRWVVPARFPVTAVFGTVELDLREAILQRRHIVIDANVLCGTVHLLVPEGVRVDVATRMVLSSRVLKVRPAGERAGQVDEGPIIEIGGTLVLGSIKVRSPKRTWRQRLRRPK
jgi:hypothetical protein